MKFHRKTSTCYIELDLHYENIVNKILHEQNNVNFFSKAAQQGAHSSSKSHDIFHVRITKPLKNMWDVKRFLVYV